jgi:hypothetical protein
MTFRTQFASVPVGELVRHLLVTAGNLHRDWNWYRDAPEVPGSTKAPRRCPCNGLSRSLETVADAPSRGGARSRALLGGTRPRVRGPGMTDFRRRLRYHQAQWREAKGHPIGSQPIVRGLERRHGSLEAAYARLRARDGRDLPHRRRTRGGESSDVLHRAAPEFRPPTTVGRPPVVAGVCLKPLRRSRRRPRARRPGSPRVVARSLWHAERGPPRAFAGSTRSRLAPEQRSARRARACARALCRSSEAGPACGADEKFRDAGSTR